MHYVYVLRNELGEYYYGSTPNLQMRLKAHNSGKNPHTKKHRPWVVVWYSAFDNKEKTLAFEKYLKTASGKAFLKKRLLAMPCHLHVSFITAKNPTEA